MQIYYCILAYNEPEMLKRIVSRLDGPNSRFIIHIQKSVDITPFLIGSQSNVYYIEDSERIETIWGDWTCVQATLLMFKKALDLSQGLTDGYCVLMSGTDYPIKSVSYIDNYFESNYPTDYFQFAKAKNLKPEFKALIDRNINNYWISFPKTKMKIEICPRKYILPRCISYRGGLLDLIKNIPVIVTRMPEIISIFLKGERTNPFQNISGIDYGASETWMELTLDSVKKLLQFQDIKLNKRVRYIHNPEEHVLQNILYRINGDKGRKDFLLTTRNREVLGTLELTDNDLKYIDEEINNPDKLFCRKVHLLTCSALLDHIDQMLLVLK